MQSRGARSWWGGAFSPCPHWAQKSPQARRLALCLHDQLPRLWLLNFNEPQISFQPRVFKVSGDERKEAVLETDGFSFFPCVSVPGRATWSQGCGCRDTRGLALLRDLGPQLDISSLLMRGQQPPVELETLFPPCSLTFTPDLGR